MRDHQPVLIEEFNGLWRRGDKETCPLDHFTDCDNVISIPGAFKTRDGLDQFIIGDDPSNVIRNVVRMYTFVHNNEEGLIVLDALGNFYHTKSPTPMTPILTIAYPDPTMIDFAFVQVANRAYISPHNGVLGLEDEFVYVYLGDGTLARKAAGNGPTGSAMIATDIGVGNIEAGIHLLAVVYETNTGFLTTLGPVSGSTKNFTVYNANPNNKVQLSGVPISPDTFVVKRHIVATKAINPVTWTAAPDMEGYEFFFVPDGIIEDNTTTTIDLSFFDADLLDSADYLFDVFSEIPAGVNLGLYHDRLLLVAVFGEPDNEDTQALPYTCYVSQKGEPEAINQVDGLIVVVRDGLPLTNAQEFRDNLYLFKSVRTYTVTDNGDVPSSWIPQTLEQGIGASVHGIATVLDSGGIDIDFLLILSHPGLYLFNGAFAKPELTWKIETRWLEYDKNLFRLFQILNDTITKRVYICTPDHEMLVADYTNALDPEKIKWWPWRFPNQVNTIAMIEFTKLLIGSRRMLEDE